MLSSNIRFCWFQSVSVAVRRSWLTIMTCLWWLVPIILVFAGWQLPGTTSIDIGSDNDGDLVQDFYAPEQNASGTYRWSQPEAYVTVPANHAPGILEVRGAVAPDGTQVVLYLGEHAQVPLPPASGEPVLRRYAMLWLPEINADGTAQLRLLAQVPEQRAEARTLGLALSSVQLRSVASIWRMPPRLPLLFLSVFPFLLALALYLGGCSGRASQAVSLIAGSVLVGLWIRHPLLVLPFLHDSMALLQAKALWRWWLALQLVMVVTLPLTLYMFRHLPWYGYAFGKALGLLVVGYGLWLLAMIGLVPFGITSWLLLLVLLVGMGGWAMRQQRWPPFSLALQQHWRGWLAYELLFVVALCVGVWLRWHGGVGPAAVGTEKPMELALLSGVLRSPSFPPQDPWFAGYAFNYYYMGYVLIALLQRLSGVSLGEAFNLGVATIFALTALSVAGLVVTLIEVTRRTEDVPPHPAARLSRTAAALLGVLLVLGVGNQQGALQVLVGSPAVQLLDGGQIMQALGQRLRGADEIRLYQLIMLGEPPVAVVITPETPRTFDWWIPSRAVWDTVVTPEGRIERRHLFTEFPFFSFYLGDLHPHVLSLPFMTLTLGLVLAVLVRPTVPNFWNGSGWLELGLTGLVLGMLYPINAWDAPTFVLLYGGALLLLYRRLAATETIAWWHYLRMLGSVGLTMLLLISPFLLTFHAPASEQPVAAPWSQIPIIRRLAQTLGIASNQTQLHMFLIIFGLFFGLLLAYTVLTHQRRRWLWVIPGLVLLFGMQYDFPLLALLPTAGLLAHQAWARAEHPAQALVLWATAVGAVVVFAVDVIYIRDYLEGAISRNNTLFKFYYQAWLIWGVLAAYMIWALLRSWRCQRVATLVWGVPVGLLLLGALVYPVGALAWADPWGKRERVLDGLAFLKEQAPTELAAMRWIQAHTEASDIVLTAFCECDYNEIGRVASVTGRPTLLGWLFGHQESWRSGIPAHMVEIRAREQDIPRIYTTTDIDEARQLLDHYGVRYVYVGPTERRLYAGPGLAKFEQFMDRVFQQGAVNIYAQPQ